MASAIPNQFLRRRSTLAYFTTEDEQFVYKYPEPDAAITTVDPIDLNQTLNFTDLNEVGTRLLNMRSVFNYGERTDATFQAISKIKEQPAAATGTDYRPAEHFLLLQLLGAYDEHFAGNAMTFGADTKDCISYSFKDTPRTFQISQLVNGVMLKTALGSILSGGSLNISREGALTWEFNSRSAKIAYSGAATIDAAATVTANTGYAGHTGSGGSTVTGSVTGGSSIASGDILARIVLAPPTGMTANAGWKAKDVLKEGDRFVLVDGSDQTTNGNVIEGEQEPATNKPAIDAWISGGMTGTEPSNYLEVLSFADDGKTVNLSAGYTAITGFGDNSNDMCYLVPVLREADQTGQGSLPIPQGNAMIYMAQANATVTDLFNQSNAFWASDFTMSIDKNLGDPGVGELNGKDFPAPTYVAQDYSVSGTMGMVVRPKDIYRFQSFLSDYDKALGIKIDIPSVKHLSGANRSIYIALRSVRISFEGAENEGAEAANISWMLTSGDSSITSDQELLGVYYA